MRYSLLSRFRGALVGSGLGELLGGSNTQGRLLDRVRPIAPNPGDNQRIEPGLITSVPKLSEWSQIATEGTESLIRRGRLDLKDWSLQSEGLKAIATTSEAAVAALPIGLFFHDNPVQLRQELRQTAAVFQWGSEGEGYEGILAVALAIALALTEKLDVATLIPQILEELGLSKTLLVQQLEQVQTLLNQRADLETTVTQLRRVQDPLGKQGNSPNTPIALAFYCFLNTPEDFRLSVTRAIRSGYQTQTTTALTGALAGVYNSITGIPIGWRLIANQIPVGVQRLQLADHLLAVWSGVCPGSVADWRTQVAVAAPGVIQPR